MEVDFHLDLQLELPAHRRPPQRQPSLTRAGLPAGWLWLAAAGTGTAVPNQRWSVLQSIAIDSSPHFTLSDWPVAVPPPTSVDPLELEPGGRVALELDLGIQRTAIERRQRQLIATQPFLGHSARTRQPRWPPCRPPCGQRPPKLPGAPCSSAAIFPTSTSRAPASLSSASRAAGPSPHLAPDIVSGRPV